MVTNFRWWWHNHYVADFFRYVGDFLNALNRSPTSQTCHQHIWSPTSVTNIDVTPRRSLDSMMIQNVWFTVCIWFKVFPIGSIFSIFLFEQWFFKFCWFFGHLVLSLLPQLSASCLFPQELITVYNYNTAEFTVSIALPALFWGKKLKNLKTLSQTNKPYVIKPSRAN